MGEKAPNLHTPEAANTNETSAERELTQEVLDESIERAQELYDSIRQFDRKNEAGTVISLNQEEWKQAGEASRELAEVLKFIPMKDCYESGLPYHPTDMKYEWPKTNMPAEPDYPVGYTHQPANDNYPERYPRADEAVAA
jgi:hypothetical protein